MLQDLKELYGKTIAALDGDIGRVKDFYFDDKSWVIRYLVADTGPWLSERLVLISPHAFAKLDHYENILHLKLLKKQIEGSPSIEAHLTVSRQYEEQYYNYYGWPVYWNGGAMWGIGDRPTLAPLPIPPPLRKNHIPAADRHLRSSLAVTGYEIEATDGPIGHVSGFVVDDRSWAIRELVVEAGHWYSGKSIPISSDRITRVSYDESRVFVSLSRADIQGAPQHPLARECIDSLGQGKFSD
jgi:hypothetical protein